ncbi:methylmalonyl-CoA mutase family protein [Shigella flexneri]
MPRYNTISISGYHMGEAGPTASSRWRLRWLTALSTSKPAASAGLKIDDFAPRLSFFDIGMNLFMNVAMLRAARYL